MIVEQYHDKIRYTLSNENIKVGDAVFPIARGRCLDNGGWILQNYDYRDFMSGFPNEPHYIKNLEHSDYKPYEVRTNNGYGPREIFYKIIKKEERIVEYHPAGGSGIRLKSRDEWVEKQK